MTIPAPHPEALAFDVFISEDEHAVVNGELVTDTDNVPVHIAVLDLLHRQARAHDGVVRASVNNRSSGEHFLLDVLPDGSSRLHATTDDVPLIPPSDENSTPSSTTAPASLTRRIAAIQQHTAAGHLRHALLLATALREHLTRRYEAAHPYALEARALEAYLAHLDGDPRRATLLALAVARVRCQNTDPHAADDVARATAAWSLLTETKPVIVHGTELLNMWQRLNDQGLVPATHSPLAQFVSGRMRTAAHRTQ